MFDEITADKHGHPQRLAPARAFSPVLNRNILALDLGTYTGWALSARGGFVTCGTEHFMNRRSWTPGQRWKRFEAWLFAMLAEQQVHVVAFESVVFGHSSSRASDVYGGFRCLVEKAVEGRNIDLMTVAVPTVKKHWTGSGRADKAAMVAEARRRGFRPDSDNAADALAVLDWAIAQEAV